MCGLKSRKIFLFRTEMQQLVILFCIKASRFLIVDTTTIEITLAQVFVFDLHVVMASVTHMGDVASDLLYLDVNK